MTILTPQQANEPRIVTLAELKAKLEPMCHGDKWALSAISDLWKKGAPIPQPAGEPERRILIPEQFALWYADFQQRLGIQRQAVDTYSSMQNKLSASGGWRKTRRRG
jgi:hypothetical protein